MAKIITTEVRLHFPNINRTFVYSYPHDFEQERVEQAMRQFYQEQAPILFALYGYGPMDVSVKNDGVEVTRYKSCYQETLWNSFFNEGGDTWRGRFHNFEISLISYRYNDDVKQLKAA